jgi:preprotein translocase subunit YajC
VTFAATLALALLSTGLIAVLFATPAQAHSSTVTVLDGSLLVRHAGGQFAPITDGDIVGRGDTVLTGSGSHGVLTFFDGTTVELEPDTQITIDDLQASASGDKIVAISQAVGRTWHVVTHLVSSRSKYEIKTGAATAEVRGTAFEVAVDPDGTMTTTTTDGDVATRAQGDEVHVLAGQFTTVAAGSRPQAALLAPEPAATVRIILDLTRNAIVTDANGRAVGVQNGLPIRYIPGSKVEVIDGKLVITIPNVQLGVLSMFITPDAPFGGSVPTSVTIQTQVTVRGIGIVVNSLTSRPVENGTAKGAIVVTDVGLFLVPDSDARNAPPPHIGTPPAAPSGIFPVFGAPRVMPLVTAASAATAPAVGPGPLTVDAPTPVRVTTAAVVPFSAVLTTPATATTAATTPVNTGLVTLTTPTDAVFKTSSPAGSAPTGAAPGATSTPAPATQPPSLVSIPPPTNVDAATATLTLPATVFATATPASPPLAKVTASNSSPLVSNPLPPTAVPVVVPTPAPPGAGGFVPPMGALVPTVPPSSTLAPIAPSSLPTPAPTPAPPPPPVVGTTTAPTAPPVLPTTPPIVTVPPAQTAAPTAAPAPVPTSKVCLPLLGCL